MLVTSHPCATRTPRIIQEALSDFSQDLVPKVRHLARPADIEGERGRSTAAPAL
jgi:hypothetical protein